MSDVVISVEGLGKKYRIGGSQASGRRYQTLQETLLSWPRKALNSFKGDKPKNEFWALKDISFEVKQGEVLGIIGRNGAGKSTLLKILSRITEPTQGRIVVNGRIGALLEVGTGFHPELTGRENIYLSGAILGMKRWEINNKFNEIVEFAELEKFIDTPAKHYSSGMYMRLGFAVAAYLEPEILIVDEVLAVGDAQFQKKCIGKMSDVSKQGRTILFVSHNIGFLNSISKKSIMLEKGLTKIWADTEEVVGVYFNHGDSNSQAVIDYPSESMPGNELVRLVSLYLKSKDGIPCRQFELNEPVRISMKYRVLKNQQYKKVYPYPNCNVYNAEGILLFYTSAPNSHMENLSKGDYVAEFEIPANYLNIGMHYVSLAFSSCDSGVDIYFNEKDALTFMMVENISETIVEERNGFSNVIPGVVRPRLKWSVNQI